MKFHFKRKPGGFRAALVIGKFRLALDFPSS